MIDAPKVTLSQIQSKIKKTEYVAHGLTTICFITLENGFVVSGESACVSPENYNVALGEKYSFEQALDKVWPLEGYLLKQKLFEAQ